MKRYFQACLSFLCIAMITVSVFASDKVQVENKKFIQFVADVRKEALKIGVSQKTVDKYLTGLKAPHRKVLHALHNQPQQKLTFKQYRKNFASPLMVRMGRARFHNYSTLLNKVEAKYKVPGQIIISIWGDESSYGKQMGKKPLVASLVTLAFQGHRSGYYRKQLFAALRILDHQRIAQQAYSYFDGGMGQPSFEPTAYFQYAVDFDKDGFANIWTSIPDIFGSIANYLKVNGWKYGQPWVLTVTLPDNFSKALAAKKTWKTVKNWQALGVKFDDKGIDSSLYASVIIYGESAFLVFHNYKVLLRWNNTSFEALSIGTLANEIAK